MAIGSVGVLAPAAAYLVLGDRAMSRLERWQAWLFANNAVVVIVVLLMIGLTLAFDGVDGLAG